MKTCILRLTATMLVAMLYCYATATADTVRPGNCSGASPGNGYCSCWLTTVDGVPVPGSGWCASAAGPIACDNGANNNCPYAGSNPPPDPPDSEYHPSN